jgi:hypothetical protein
LANSGWRSLLAEPGMRTANVWSVVPFFARIHKGFMQKARSKKKKWAKKLLKKRVRVLWTRYWPTYTFAFLSLFLVAFSKSDHRQEDTRPISLSEVVAEYREPNPETLEPWSFFRPAWKETAAWNLLPIRANTPDSYFDTLSNNQKIVYDPEDKLESEFKVPNSLRSQVLFWMDVYSRFSSRVRIVHDRANLDLVYGYIDFRALYRSMGSYPAATAKANQIEKKILKEIKLRIAEASGIAASKNLSLEEKEEIRSFLSRFGGFSKASATTFIDSMRTQSGQSDVFLMALYRSRQLLPHIESVFRQNGIPVRLARIPFVESSFNARAESKIGAVGIWQFTRETAREMIHKEDTKLWSDPLRQTRSAARLLKMYRSVLPDWGTTITAYNSGVGRLRRLVEKYGISRGEQLAQIPHTDKTGLGFAGRNFYAEFLAASLVEAYKEDIFQELLVPTGTSVVVKGKESMPKEVCDL